PIKIPFLYHGTCKHHSFFYFDCEAFHQAGGSNVPTLSIPSVLERGGNFTDWKDSSGNLIPIYMPGNASAACQAAAGVGPGQQFPGNKIPSNCFSQIALVSQGNLAETIPRQQDPFELFQPNCLGLPKGTAPANKRSAVQQLHAFQASAGHIGLQQ